MSDDHTSGGSTEGDKTPKDRLLDLFVFGPAGLALTAAEEFPKLVQKGRHRVEGQVHTARLVGQFAVQMGRQQIESSLGNLFSRGDEHRPTVVHAPQSHGEPSAGERSEGAVASSPAVERSTAPVSVPGAAPSSNGTMASSALAIPGYDSLSASQVVQRLGGLTPDELGAVREHELAHRHRRTILNRVDQLLSGADPDS